MLPTAMLRLAHGPVVLRAFRDADAPLVGSVAGDPLIPLITTVPTSGTQADALAFIARQHARLAEGTGYSFAIADAPTDEAVGHIGLWLRAHSAGHTSSGCWVGPAFRGRGYAGAALRVLSDWALGLDEVARLELHVEPWNEGSCRAAVACGFAREGLLRSWQQVGEERRDMLVYSRIAGEG